MIAGVAGVAGNLEYFLPELQPARARWGPFSNANYWSGTPGVGFDFQNDRVFWVQWWTDAFSTNNQTLWCFNTASTGWTILHGNANPNTVFLAWLGSGGNIPFANVYRGLSRMCIRMRAGVLNWSLNGSVPTVLAMTGTYTAGGGSAVHAIGRDVGRASFPMTQRSFIGCGVIDDASFSDSAMQLASGFGAPLDRFGTPSVIASNAGLQWLCPADGWDGVSATYAGTAGSNPVTMTRAGTGGGKTVLPEYLRYRIPYQACSDVAKFYSFANVNGQSCTRANPYLQVQLRSSCIDIAGGPSGLVVDSYAAHWSVPGNIQAGAVISGTQQAGNQNGLNPIPGNTQVSGYGELRDVDSVGVPAGSNKDIEIIAGVQTAATGTVCSASSPGFVRVPKTTPLIWRYRNAASKVVLFVGDSRFGQIMGVNDSSSPSALTGPPYKAWPALVRTNFTTSRVAAIGHGFGSWAERVSTPSLRASFIAETVLVLKGTTENRLWIDMGFNDWNVPLWVSRASFKAAVKQYAIDMLAEATAIGIAGFQLFLVKTVSATGDTVPNAGLYNLPDLGDAQQEIVTEIADSRCLFFDARDLLGAPPANRPDGIHFDQTGQDLYQVGGPKVAFGY